MSASPDEDLIGTRVEVEVGAVAHGGHFVARHDGRVIFVRHALPGERVTVEITEDSGRFLRGDAVSVERASEHRVEAPCSLARPHGCGGCDFQHVALDEQRRLKAAVVAEQLQRLAGIQRDVVVEPVPGDDHGLRWRTRMQYVGLRDGQRGLRRHRSHEVIPVEDCLIAHPAAREVLVSERGRPAPSGEITSEEVLGRTFDVAADGFWQVHPGAPATLVQTVLELADPQPGDLVWDLFSGVGLFTAFLADRVGPEGRVIGVEGDRRASDLAATNLADLPQASFRTGRVDRVLHHARGETADLVVLDPPREGAKRQVVRAIAEMAPRAVVYVACDPAALARDIGYFVEAGYELTTLRAYDVFPMTHHVECVALLTKTGSDLR